MKLLQMPMLRRGHLAMTSWLVVLAWLAGTAGAFWFFELSDWRAFGGSRARTSPAVDTGLVEEWFRSSVARPSPRRALAGITVVHLYTPGCRCNRFIEPHLRRLQGAFQGMGVRFMTVAASDAADSPVPLGLEAIHSDATRLRAAGIDSAPSALIFDGDGRLLYFGPYSNSAWCGSAGALVDPVLRRALSGSARFTGVPLARGCFCEW